MENMECKSFMQEKTLVANRLEIAVNLLTELTNRYTKNSEELQLQNRMVFVYSWLQLKDEHHL